MSTLALVFTAAQQRARPTLIDARLTGLCTRWLLISENGSGDQRASEIQNALNGVSGEVLALEPVPQDERPEFLLARLQNHATNVLFLETGNIVECDFDFCLAENGRAEQILHLAPKRDLACWRTALVPAGPGFWEIDEHGNIVVIEQKEALRNKHLRILNCQHFERGREAMGKELEALVTDYQKAPGGADAIRIATGLLKQKDAGQALNWYRAVLANGNDPALAWEAHFGAALCLLQNESDWAETETHLAAAFDLNPDRMEPLYHLVAHYRAVGDYPRAKDLAAVAYEIEEPNHPAVFEFAIYRYRLTVEYAACCLELGHDARCIEVINETLRRTGVPEAERRVLAETRARAHERAYPVYPVSIHRRNKLLIVVAFRNAGEFLERCVSSIQRQDYPDYRVVLIDDASSDGALGRLGDLGERFTVVINESPAGILSNQLRAIQDHASDEDIIVHLDGDDWLAHEQVFSRVNDFFNRTRCAIMYGQYRTSLGTYGQCEPLVPGIDTDSQVTKMHFPMHMRAYRAAVIDALIKQDPDLDVLKDAEDNFLDAVSDLALMRVLFQITGPERVRFNEEILYVYNRQNPESHYLSRSAIALQRSQSQVVGAKLPLQQVEYLWQRPAKNAAQKTRTLFIALDAMTPELMEHWAAEQELPNLAHLLQQCHRTSIRVPEGFGNDAFWTGIATGKRPDETGYFFRMIWNPDDYKIEFRPPAEQVRDESFWTVLADGDLEIAVIDMPEVKCGGRINGLEISEWLPHARSMSLETCPPGLRDDVLARFGNDPNKGSTERSTPRSEAETQRDINLLLQSVEQKTRGAEHYLQRGGWDLFAVGYQQAHDAGHQFWHLHDTSHPRFSRPWVETHGDPLLKVYQSIDHGIGTLWEAAGHDTNLVLVAGLSMRAKMSCNSVLDRILWELDVNKQREAGKPNPAIDQLDRRRFIAIPHNNMSGAVRINLRGRESRGIVADGDEYQLTMALLEEKLSQVVNTATGKPVVAGFIPVREQYTGAMVDRLPDLLLVWDRTHPVAEISAPWCGKLSVRARSELDTRTGDHVGQAVLYSNIATVSGDARVIGATQIAGRLVAAIQR